MDDFTTQNCDPMTEELALLSHDIRSAMTDILAGLALIDTANLPPHQQQQLARTQAASEGLMRLLGDGLTTLLAHAPAQMRQAPLDLAVLIQDMQRRWSYNADGRPTAIIRAKAGLPPAVCCNRTAVERILANLISNAVGYSGNQPVEVDIFINERQELCFNIRDHGPGFPDALTRPVSSPMRTGSALPLWHSAAGHGLGLRIALNLSERVGGKVTLQNAATGGGLAQLRLPLGDLAESTPPEPDAKGRLLRQKVLVADDSATQLLLMAQFLGDCGAEVTIARNGIDALSALQTQHFDIVMLDMELPGRSGLDVAAALRDFDPRPRIVFLTAHSAAASIAAAHAAGAERVLAKPITSANQLAAALAAPHTAPPAAPPTARPQAETAVFEHLLDMAGPDMAPELIARFQTDLADVQSQLVAALPARDWTTLRAASHVLVALAGTAGAQGLEADARLLNIAATEGADGGIDTLGDTVLNGLARLIAFVDQTAQNRSAPV